MSSIKIVIIGSGGVGKSAVTARYIGGAFVDKYDPTIEESYKKTVDIDGKVYSLDILDTAGQEEFSALRDSYMKQGDGFVLMYAINSSHSFEVAKSLRAKVVRIKEEFTEIPIQLVGNKCDQEEDRQVSKAEAQTYAASISAGFVETSAKLGTNIDVAFDEVVRSVIIWKEKNGNKKKSKGLCLIL